MTRIAQTFRSLQKHNKKALIPFITAGDPSLSETEKLIFTLERAGADIIELGIPFSDPMADGPVIQAASERALKKGVTLNQVLQLVKKVRQKTQIPLLLMGYYNPIFQMGLETFSKKAADAGVDAVLVVDLPPEEGRSLYRELKKNRIDSIRLLTPTSDDERMKRALKMASGFVYYVSLTGITGARLEMNREISDQLKKIRQKTRLPLVVGFGISKPDQAQKLSQNAQGIVIGSALIRLIAQTPKQKIHSKVLQFIQSFRQTLDY